MERLINRLFAKTHRSLRAFWVLVLLNGTFAASAAFSPVYQNEIQPLLEKYCYDCHGGGMDKGSVVLDAFKSAADLSASHDLWWQALKNLQGGLMPPAKKAQPTAAEKKQILDWIQAEVFQADPLNPDPGRVTVRRLNRVEYHNTIRDLLGVDFNAEAEFPPDDTGHGFDNISDVLTLPPMLLEKYLAAAKTIVTEAVPTVPFVPAEHFIGGKRFLRDSGKAEDKAVKGGDGPLGLSYYQPAKVSHEFKAEKPGTYRLIVELGIKGNASEQFDSNRCHLTFTADGTNLISNDYGWQEKSDMHFEWDRAWAAGGHRLDFEVTPLPAEAKQISALEIRVISVKVRGPMEKENWVRPKNHSRFFAGKSPVNAKERRVQGRELLGGFARKAFRRPVDDETVNRLTALAEEVWKRKSSTFEAGVAHAMTAILASPRFLFREEGIEATASKNTHPLVDEYALASRLSYFLWSSMPDEELLQLAASGSLRKNFAAQVQRLLADARSEALVQNFSGQWLQTRDIEGVPIDARAVLAREESLGPEGERLQARFRELRNKPEGTLTVAEKEEFPKVRVEYLKRVGRARIELDGELRKAMRQETERYFGGIVRENRSVLELLDSDYAFLNERLAKHYGLTNLNVTGSELRRVSLPAGSPRGGVLTQGSVLAVTSNPTRTSPVKRGLFVLENILGTPPPPPPPDIPALEESAKSGGREPTLREMLEIHRSKPLCNSCHNRMDPLGLAFENFNAMGMWREKERNQPIDAVGKLITGEAFQDIRDVKRLLAANHRTEFYRTLTEKLLTYALGRGVEYYDVPTVEQIVGRLEAEDGRFSALLSGVVESAAFQKQRRTDEPGPLQTSKPVQQRAESQ